MSTLNIKVCLQTNIDTKRFDLCQSCLLKVKNLWKFDARDADDNKKNNRDILRNRDRLVIKCGEINAK